MHVLKVGVLLAGFLSIDTFAASAPSVNAILKGADLARSGSAKGMTWEVEVASDEQGTKTLNRYKVKTKGENALAEALSPPRSKGEFLLFNGRLLWFYRPGINRPVSLPLRQRLSGQAANGDITHTNYVRDYEGKLVGEEVVDGKAAFVMMLKAKQPEVTYEKIRYWVSKDKLQGIKAQFMTAEETVLKSATFVYGNQVKVAGKDLDFIKEIFLQDEANTMNKSVMRFIEPRSDTHDDAIFDVNNTKR